VDADWWQVQILQHRATQFGWVVRRAFVNSLKNTDIHFFTALTMSNSYRDAKGGHKQGTSSRKMKPYGVNPMYDQDCCPGHSTFSADTYNSTRSKKAHTKYSKVAHRRARRISKQQLQTENID